VLISTKGRYALRVMTDMAEHQLDGYVPLKEIAERQEISEKYLESIVKSLVKEGVLIGLRGKGGGYRLSKSPDQFTVGSILRLTEGSLVPVACLEKNATPCTRAASCRTLSMWSGLNKTIYDYLESYTIADLMRADEPGNDYVI
jgi:Rrf2 family protein